MPSLYPGPNDRPLAEFAGLSPNQVHQLLQDFLGPDSIVQLAGPEQTCRQDMPLVRYVEDLLDRLQEGDIKLTPGGNLPTQLVQSWFDLRLLPDAIANPANTPRMREDAFPPAQVAKHLSLIQGYVKKRHNALSLTAKGRKMREQPTGILLRELLLGQLRRFNLGWADGYDPSSALQHVFGFLAYLLLRYGAEGRPTAFYADRVRNAFPVLEEHFPGSNLQDALTVRLLEHFLAHYGMVRLQYAGAGISTVLVETTECFRSVFRLKGDKSPAPAVRFDARAGGPSYSPAELPVEMVESFAAQLRAFEEHAAASGKVSIGSLLGTLSLVPPEDIPDAATADRECRRITTALAARGIYLDGEAAATLGSAGYYAYLYHDLLPYSIPSPRPGESRTITYAEVRMDRVAPTEALMETFLLSLFRLSVPFPVDLLARKVRLDGRVISRQRALDKILDWRRSWGEVEQLAFDAVDPRAPAIGELRPQGSFLVGYRVRSATAEEAYTFAGEGTVEFIHEDGEWRIAGAGFPGFPP